jgi:flagellar protein FlaJ
MKKRSKKIEFDYRIILEYTLIGLTISSYFLVGNYIFENFSSSQTINLFIIMPIIIFLTPYLIMKLYDLKKVESKMKIVPRFLRDIVDNVESGMDLISSIKATENNEYGILNEEITKMSNQLTWGVSFDDTIINFSNNVGSKTLKRDLKLIIEARRVGGHVEKLLRELSEKINTENLRVEERKSNLASNTFTGYISFIIFVVMIIMIYNGLFLEIGGSFSDSSNLNPYSNEILGNYLTILILLTYELAVLSGFLFGLMQENNIISGAPHVVALSLITFVGFFFFI